jgi:hypothetical protein
MYDYKVIPIKSNETYEWLLQKHYAKRIPNIMFAFGLYCNSNLTGICTYGMPASNSLCEGICGKKYKNIVIELNRLCLENNKKNESSYLISGSLKLLPKPKIIVSYADTSKNHTGYIYQATNFYYTGVSAKRTDVDTGNKHPRHYKNYDTSKRKNRSSKHRYVYFIGTKRQKKELLSNLNYQIKPYPKGDNIKYNSGGSVNKQMIFEL